MRANAEPPRQAHKPESPHSPEETVDESASHAHPSDSQLCLFVGGQLREFEASEIQKHLESCHDCIATINQFRVIVVTRLDTINQTKAGDVTNKAATGDPNETVDQSIETTLATRNEANSEEGVFGDYELIDEIARGGMGVVSKPGTVLSPR